MTQQLRKLGIALVAVFALTALTASAAMAAEAHFTSEAGTTTLSGSGAAEIFKTTAGNVECKEAIYSGSTVQTATAQTVKAHYTHCSVFSTNDTTIDMNTCHYTFKAGTFTPTGTANGTADIVCTTKGDSITVTAPGCTIHVPEQSGLKNVHYQTVVNPVNGKEEIVVTPQITNIRYIHTGFCGFGEASTGTYEGKATIKGTNSKGAQTHITITST